MTANVYLREASDSGGKAGKGRNKTSSISVVRWEPFAHRIFRFDVDSVESYNKAMAKAKAKVE